MSHAGRGRVLLQCSETLRIRGGYKWSFENKLKWTLVKSCKNHKFPSVAAILLASQRQRVPEKNLFPDCLGDPNTGWSKVHRLIRECRVLSVCYQPVTVSFFIFQNVIRFRSPCVWEMISAPWWRAGSGENTPLTSVQRSRWEVGGLLLRQGKAEGEDTRREDEFRSVKIA